ncbi:MAG: hypothetical protein AAF696_24755 [Bacteroidota bacterium]
MKTHNLLLVIFSTHLIFQLDLVGQNNLINHEMIEIYESIGYCTGQEVNVYTIEFKADSLLLSRFSDPIRTGPRYVDAYYNSKKSFFRKHYGTGIEFHFDLNKILSQCEAEYAKFTKTEKTKISETNANKLFSWLDIGIHQRIRSKKIRFTSATSYVYLIKIGDEKNKYSLISESFSLFLKSLFENQEQ